MTDETPNADSIVRRIVNAWDCCGTCAGGVLARYVRERIADAQAQAWDEGAHAAVEVYNTGTRMTLRARIPFPADENPYRSGDE